MKHVFEKHQECEYPHCPYHEGKLLYCLVCGGAEASLPTDCPGRKMTEQEEDDVMNSRLDYEDGYWKTIHPYRDEKGFIPYVLVSRKDDDQS